MSEQPELKLWISKRGTAVFLPETPALPNFRAREIPEGIDTTLNYVWISDDYADIWNAGGHLEELPAPVLSLADRLRAITTGFAPEIRAGFPFERVAYWLSLGDEGAAQAVIEAVDVSAMPQPVQDAKAALLSEFD